MHKLNCAIESLPSSVQSLAMATFSTAFSGVKTKEFTDDGQLAVDSSMDRAELSTEAESLSRCYLSRMKPGWWE